ncbi:MAG: DUF3021 domain-containing protein [Ruminococcaceae bacterium]|nr:DUF3021 domain-containing protein [Oscillospiraceae bacterium]
MMKRIIREIFVITCCSYTAVTMLFVMFSNFNMTEPLSNEIALMLLCMCFSTALGMLAADKIIDAVNIETLLPEILLRMGICYVIVFFEGALFHMFPFDIRHLFGISPILLPVYFLTHFATYHVNVECANEINKKIKSENEKTKKH